MKVSQLIQQAFGLPACRPAATISLLKPFRAPQPQLAPTMADLKKPLASRWECANCSLPEQPGVALRPCSRCKLVRYCGTECQAQHWKKGGHKKHCVAPEQRKPQPATQDDGDRVGSPTCAICMEAMDMYSVELSCLHTFHRRCMAELESNSSARACPVCRAEVAPGSILYRAEESKIDQNVGFHIKIDQFL